MANQELINNKCKSISSVCPHCHAGIDGAGLGLFWDFDETAWRCIFCGHRSFEQKKKTEAELLEETLWDQILATLDTEEKEQEQNRDEKDD
ncbi:MAG TPA: hypothetical protein VN944_12575 [Nitrospiria bacterium]|nr:hypothetical protein [Nitrospiria bacterium]